MNYATYVILMTSHVHCVQLHGSVCLCEDEFHQTLLFMFGEGREVGLSGHQNDKYAVR